MCYVCQRTLPRDSFTRHDQSRNCNLFRNRKRCNDCMVCRACRDVKRSPSAFSTEPDYEHLCIECEPKQCARCSRVQPRRDFPPRMISNNKTRGGMLLCNVCTEAGFTGKNTRAFECRGCNQVYGHKRFDAKEIRLHTITNCVDRVRAKPLCNECAQKVKLLRAEVNKSGRRCKCNGAPNHKDSCPFGIPRRAFWWPGGEHRRVSADDKHLLDRANMQWWKDLHIPSGI